MWKQGEPYLALHLSASWIIQYSLPPNYGVAFSPRVPGGSLLVPPLLTSTLGCSLHFQRNVWAKIVEEILPSTGSSIIGVCSGYEIQAGPYQQWLLSCMLDLMLVYLSHKRLHDVWFIERSCWYNTPTAFLGSRPRCSMIVLPTSYSPEHPEEDLHSVCFALLCGGCASHAAVVLIKESHGVDVFRSTSLLGLPPEGWMCCISGRKAGVAWDAL